MQRGWQTLAVVAALVAYIGFLFWFWRVYGSPFDVQSFLSSDHSLFFTFINVLATVVVAWFTVVLAGVGRRQVQDTRILQRAYLGTKPGGIHRMTDGTFIAYVTFINVGNLPARNVRNEVKIGWFKDGNKSKFENIKITEPGVIRLLPKNEVERGTRALSKDDTDHYRKKEGFIFVWGRVEYEDGFGHSRWMTYCHRYNCTKPKVLRQHHYHNDGN